MFRSEDYRCAGCHHTWDKLVDSVLKDELQICPECEALAGERTIATPRGLIQKAAFVMGTKRKGFKELTEANDLKLAMYDTRVENRKELQKEITKLEKI